MTQHTLSLDEALSLSLTVLEKNGFSPEHAGPSPAISGRASADECHSHGLYRLLVCTHTLKDGKVSPDALPEVHDVAPGLVRVDAKGAYSLLSFENGLPVIGGKGAQTGDCRPGHQSLLPLFGPMA